MMLHIINDIDILLVTVYAAEEMNLPYLNAYLNSVGSDFCHVANFAGEHIVFGDDCIISPFDLMIQIAQFKQFKRRLIFCFNVQVAVTFFVIFFPIFRILCELLKFRAL